MKTDNELIAEFMGIKCSPVGCTCSDNGRRLINVDELEYDERWDWLMTVVERIELLGDSNDKVFRSSEFHELMELSIKTSIERVYYFVIEFIKWYNSNKDL